jgi:hypothetical protein
VGFLLGMAALIPVLGAGVVTAAVAQAVAIVRSETIRPADEEPQAPRLYGADQDPPFILRWLPGAILGGRPQPESDLSEPAH